MEVVVVGNSNNGNIGFFHTSNSTKSVSSQYKCTNQNGNDSQVFLNVKKWENCTRSIRIFRKCADFLSILTILTVRLFAVASAFDRFKH